MATQYRADHVGSFLRPSELLEARNNPKIVPQQLRALEDVHMRICFHGGRELDHRRSPVGQIKAGRRRRTASLELTDDFSKK
jgi:hypothetical protein